MPDHPPPPTGRAATSRGAVPTPPELARRLATGFEGGPAARGPWLDPACGAGALLAAALEVLGGDPAVRCFGIETDAERLARARERLGLRGGPQEWGPNANLRRADALDAATDWPAGTHLLANPPWVSFSGRHAATDTAVPDRHRGPGGWPALHAAFLLRSARHLERHGTQGRFLLPASVATHSGYEPLRAAVEAHAHLVARPAALGEDAFPGVHEPAILLHLGPGPGAADWTPAVAVTAAPPDPILEHLARYPRTPARTFADAGLHTGNAAAALVHDVPGPDRAPLREGRDLSPFELGAPRRFVDTALAPSDERRFRRKSLDAYRAFPVLVRQTADRPIAALHEPAEAFRNSLLAARPLPELDPAVLVAVLNSPLAARWHRARHADARQRRFPQVKVGHLQGLPLPFLARREDPERHDALARRVRALRPGAPERARHVRAIEVLVAQAYGLEEDGTAR